MKFKKPINKIKTAKKHVNNALSMFTKAASDIDTANNLLSEVKQSGITEKNELNNRIQSIDNEINSVEEEMLVNNELKKQFQAFLPSNKRTQE